ncbi:MAG: hypothetical protein SGCHY_003705 [Lobulomycetales sp.]
MGALLSVLKSSGNTNEEPPYHINHVDLEAASPSERETEFYTYINSVLNPSTSLLESLRSYSGCGEHIRKAISSPSPETEEAAWNAVCPAVGQLKQFYELAMQIDECFGKTLQFLCSGPVLENLEQCQATAKKLADILYISAQFDEIKIGNPSIQNDFSYYRRTLSKMRMSNPAPMNLVVNDELANRMSLFYAQSTPLTKLLIDTAQGLVSKGVSNSEISDCFAIMSAICYYTVQRPEVETKTDYFLRVMVLCIILYDQVNTTGAFHKQSTVNIRASVKVIQSHGGSLVESLMNNLKYATVHLNDEATPKATKALFA